MNFCKIYYLIGYFRMFYAAGENGDEDLFEKKWAEAFKFPKWFVYNPEKFAIPKNADGEVIPLVQLFD